MKKYLRGGAVMSSVLICSLLEISAQAAPVIIRPRPGNIVITPHLTKFINIGYKVDKKVPLMIGVTPQNLVIPEPIARPAANEQELLNENEFVMMTKSNEEAIQLVKPIQLNELRRWGAMKIGFDKTFIPNIGELPGEPPAGEAVEEGRLIIRPIPSPIPRPNPIPIPRPLPRPTDSFEDNDNTPVSDDINLDTEGDFIGIENNLESVLGADGRTQVTPTTNYPYRAVGLVGGHCSGTLIGPRHVLTAAHCVYNTDTNSWIGDLNFTPGRDGSGVPYAPVAWSRVIAKQGWTVSHKTDYDWALIVLAQPVGNSVGWFGYGYNYAQPVINLNTAGYPGDKNFGTMWRAYCPGVGFNYLSSKVAHKCDTYPGQSGSAMWMYIAPNYRSIRAVHTNGSSAGYYVSDANWNYASTINAYVFNTLVRWKSENP